MPKLIELVIEPGCPCRLDTERGVFRILGTRDNGDVDLWGGTPGREKNRSVRPERLKPARQSDLPPPVVEDYMQLKKGRRA